MAFYKRVIFFLSFFILVFYQIAGCHIEIIFQLPGMLIAVQILQKPQKDILGQVLSRLSVLHAAVTVRIDIPVIFFYEDFQGILPAASDVLQNFLFGHGIFLSAVWYL